MPACQGTFLILQLVFFSPSKPRIFNSLYQPSASTQVTMKPGVIK